MSGQEATNPAVPDALVIDRRRQTPAPGLHALVVGISAYQHLPEHEGSAEHEGRRTYGLAQLRSAATAACKFVEFLHQLPYGVRLTRPLKTCRLLLSPHPDELSVVAQTLSRLGSAAVPAPITDEIPPACAGWREDAEADGPDALTLFHRCVPNGAGRASPAFEAGHVGECAAVAGATSQCNHSGRTSEGCSLLCG